MKERQEVYLFLHDCIISWVIRASCYVIRIDGFGFLTSGQCSDGTLYPYVYYDICHFDEVVGSTTIP
jgi:hypothetical protein